MDRHERAKRLAVWSEIAGTVDGLRSKDCILTVDMSGNKVILPEDMANNLEGYRGKRIAILRTDTDYRIRELPPIPIEYMHVHVHLSDPISEAV
jgi:hypothetical protein